MRKVNKYTIIIISISLFIAMPLFLGTPKQRAAKREFSNKFEAYNAIKESLINELQKSNYMMSDIEKAVLKIPDIYYLILKHKL